MPPSHRVRVILEGDLARALNWEAERRGMAAQGLARDLLAESGARIVELWRHGRRRLRGADLPSPTQAKGFEAVLKKSYGPETTARGAGHPEGTGAA